MVSKDRWAVSTPSDVMGSGALACESGVGDGAVGRLLSLEAGGVGIVAGRCMGLKKACAGS